jgi:hypothetical protein
MTGSLAARTSGIDCRGSDGARRKHRVVAAKRTYAAARFVNTGNSLRVGCGADHRVAGEPPAQEARSPRCRRCTLAICSQSLKKRTTNRALAQHRGRQTALRFSLPLNVRSSLQERARAALSESRSNASATCLNSQRRQGGVACSQRSCPRS